jgi:hypothetical protein
MLESQTNGTRLRINLQLRNGNYQGNTYTTTYIRSQAKTLVSTVLNVFAISDDTTQIQQLAKNLIIL